MVIVSSRECYVRLGALSTVYLSATIHKFISSFQTPSVVPSRTRGTTFGQPLMAELGVFNVYCGREGWLARTTALASRRQWGPLNLLEHGLWVCNVSFLVFYKLLERGLWVCNVSCLVFYELLERGLWVFIVSFLVFYELLERGLGTRPSGTKEVGSFTERKTNCESTFITSCVRFHEETFTLNVLLDGKFVDAELLLASKMFHLGNLISKYFSKLQWQLQLQLDP
uniref:Uncharacterized protein n=1 Tax=Timema tahoe TaxID=61484 RepID=A0A7R9IH36_9NEOP|nr:unnamed protein product [Timema tahoe]